MKLSKKEKEIEALLKRGEIALAKPGKDLLRQLRTATENNRRKDSAPHTLSLPRTQR